MCLWINQTKQNSSKPEKSRLTNDHTNIKPFHKLIWGKFSMMSKTKACCTLTENVQTCTCCLQLSFLVGSGLWRCGWSGYCFGGLKQLGENKNFHWFSRCPQLRMVWTSCEGETAADKENIGLVTYTPKQGFPGYYYPYLNQMHYLSPIVWLQFRSITPGVLIQIRSTRSCRVEVPNSSIICRCRAWAKNIQHDDRNARIGGVHFELLMDWWAQIYKDYFLSFVFGK